MRAHVVKPVPGNPVFFTQPAAARPRKTGIIDWLFGKTSTDTKDPNPPHTEPYVAPDVRVTPPVEGTVWIEGFFNALTEATTLFAKRHVELVHQEDPSTVYKVREVKIECKDAPAQFHRDVLSLPALVRNRVVKSRMQKAPGAECLMLNDFFGSTIAADITLLEGQVVQTMVSYSGSRFVLKFAFEGEYMTRPEISTEPVPPDEVEVQAPASSSSVRVQAPGKGLAATATPSPGALERTPADPDGIGTVQQTLLRLRPDDEEMPAPESRATPLQQASAPEFPAVAKLRLRSLGAEVTLPLWEDNFPYSIGRHPGFRGYGVRGQRDNHTLPLLGDVEPADFCSFVSREHIVLDGFDPTTRQFRVAAAKGKNGSYFQNNAMPSHFLLPMAMMAKGDWLRLGGMNGDGILEVRIEAA